MIRIRKPKKAPAVLRQKGKAAAAVLCAAYDAAPDEYANGERRFEVFDRSIYAAETVKRALLRAQHGKCAFCEAYVPHVSYGDVEHFRPKAGFKQDERDPLGRPGYYWLAYTWANLYFACQICNQQFKRNLFSLVKPEHRARCHRHRVSREEPLLVDPGNEKPEDFLTFESEYATAVDGHVRGKSTIQMLGLNREELAGSRRARLATLRELLNAYHCLSQRLDNGTATAEEIEQFNKIDAHFEHLKRDQAEYAAMTRAALAKARSD